MVGMDIETNMLLSHMMNKRLSRKSSNQEPVELPLCNIIRWELTQRNSERPAPQETLIRGLYHLSSQYPSSHDHICH